MAFQILLWFLLVFFFVALVWAALRIFPNSIVLVTGLTLAGFLCFLVFSYFAYRWNMAFDGLDPYEEQRAAERLDLREKLSAESRARLSALGWVDQAKGVVQIPIAEAMKLQVAALKSKPVTAANPVEPIPAPAAPPPSPAPAPATPSEGVAPVPTPLPETVPPAPAPTPMPAPRPTEGDQP